MATNYYSNQMVTQVTGTVRVDNLPAVLPVTGTILANAPRANSANGSTFESTDQPFQMVGQNYNRKQLWVYNTGSSYLCLGLGTVTTSSYFLKMDPNSFWELPIAGGVYTGAVWAVFSGTLSGYAQVTEVV